MNVKLLYYVVGLLSFIVPAFTVFAQSPTQNNYTTLDTTICHGSKTIDTLFYENFENGFSPLWTLTQPSAANWKISSNEDGLTPAIGNKALYGIGSNASQHALAATPQIPIAYPDQTTITFKYCYHGTATTHNRVRIKYGHRADRSFTQLEPIAFEDNNWHTYSRQLSSLSKGLYYFAFESDNANGLPPVAIDEVLITRQLAGRPIPLAVLSAAVGSTITTYDTLISSTGQYDSIVKITWHIAKNADISTYDSVVNSDQFPLTWHNLIFPRPTQQLDVLPSATGCDSLVTHTIHIRTTRYDTICQGDTTSSRTDTLLFETFSNSSALPLGWKSYAGTGSSPWKVKSSIALEAAYSNIVGAASETLTGNPGNALYQSRRITGNGTTSSCGNHSVVVLPPINITNPQNISISFDYSSRSYTTWQSTTITSNSIDTLKLSYGLTDGIEFDTPVLYKKNKDYFDWEHWSRYSIPLPNLPTGQLYLKLINVDMGGAWAAFDNILVAESQHHFVPSVLSGWSHAGDTSMSDTTFFDDGYDSISVTYWTINPAYNDTTTHVVCEDMLPYQWQGETIASFVTNQTYFNHTKHGCDSLATLTLKQAPIPTLTGTADTSQTICQGDSITPIVLTTAHAAVEVIGLPDGLSYNDATHTISGAPTVTPTAVAVYHYTCIASSNQDSAMCGTVSLTGTISIKPTRLGADTQTTCDSFTWIDHITYTESTTNVTYTFKDAQNCDSTITL
ncbi:MAG: choice-of-anchor J domain-containing protein, partial [Bacteroidales bacterium]|nr:choice-of-anchor J domain-containing protein [Candidatus Colimorpha onthohippi]